MIEKWLKLLFKSSPKSSLWYFLYLLGSCICFGTLWGLANALQVKPLVHSGQNFDWSYSKWQNKAVMRNNSQTLRRQPKYTYIVCNDELSSLNIVTGSTVSLVISSRVWSFYVNLKVWDPNLKGFSYSFSKPQGLGISEVGRSHCGI